MTIRARFVVRCCGFLALLGGAAADAQDRESSWVFAGGNESSVFYIEVNNVVSRDVRQATTVLMFLKDKPGRVAIQYSFDCAKSDVVVHSAAEIDEHNELTAAEEFNDPPARPEAYSVGESMLNIVCRRDFDPAKTTNMPSASARYYFLTQQLSE